MYREITFLLPFEGETAEELQDTVEDIFETYSMNYGTLGDSWWYRIGAVTKSGLMIAGENDHDLPKKIRTATNPWQTILNQLSQKALIELDIQFPAAQTPEKCKAHYLEHRDMRAEYILQETLEELENDADDWHSMGTFRLRQKLLYLEAAYDAGKLFPFSYNKHAPYKTWPLICWDLTIKTVSSLQDDNAAIAIANFHC